MSRLRVIQGGGGGGQSRYQQSLEEATGLVQTLLAGRQSPVFNSFRDLDAFLKGRGYKLTKAELFGPKDPTNPKGFVQDAAQAIYSNGEGTVIAKIKTRGYSDGKRGG